MSLITYDKVVGLSPALKQKYWSEVISRGARRHRDHPLNTRPADLLTARGSEVGKCDFDADNWRSAVKRYYLAAGVPTTFIQVAREREKVRVEKEAYDERGLRRSTSEGPGVMRSSRSRTDSARSWNKLP